MGTDDLSLDPNIRSAETIEFQRALRAKIVGQDEAVQALVQLFQVFTAGLNSPGRPVGNLLFLGPPVRAKHVSSKLARKSCSAVRERSSRLTARNSSILTRLPS